jgi:hypothetical protein
MDPPRRFCFQPAGSRTAGITSQNGLARALNGAGVPTARGGKAWTAGQVGALLRRLEVAA